MNPQNVIDLAQSYTAEAAELKDYQVPTRNAKRGRTDAKDLLKRKDGYFVATYAEALCIADENNLDIEDYTTEDPNEYIWALVPEYDHHRKANVVLRRIGTPEGEILLPKEKRRESSLKINEEGRMVIRTRNQMAIIPKLRNYESQIRRERLRLQEQIRNGDKVYMEAEAIELKRICEEMKDDLDEFLNLINH